MALFSLSNLYGMSMFHVLCSLSPFTGMLLNTCSNIGAVYVMDDEVISCQRAFLHSVTSW